MEKDAVSVIFWTWHRHGMNGTHELAEATVTRSRLAKGQHQQSTLQLAALTLFAEFQKGGGKERP